MYKVDGLQIRNFRDEEDNLWTPSLSAMLILHAINFNFKNRPWVHLCISVLLLVWNVLIVWHNTMVELCPMLLSPYGTKFSIGRQLPRQPDNYLYTVLLVDIVASSIILSFLNFQFFVKSGQRIGCQINMELAKRWRKVDGVQDIVDTTSTCCLRNQVTMSVINHKNIRD